MDDVNINVKDAIFLKYDLRFRTANTVKSFTEL